MQYYRLYTGIAYPNRWYLGDVNVDDDWIFVKGQPLDENNFKNLMVKVYQKGNEMDFTETNVFSAPVVSERFTEWLYEYMNEVQLLPVKIPNTSRRYFILVVKNKIDCVDESKSSFTKFTKGDAVRPDLAGEYSSFKILKIDPTIIDKSIFRLDKFPMYIIINRDIKDKLEKAKVTGVKFKLVS
jgi:hypothetical protein